MQCASVDINGDVTLQWNKASDPSSEFINYQVYDVGTGTLLTTITDINIETYTVLGAGADINTEDYYIITNHTGASSPEYSDTIGTIFLKLNIIPGVGILQWNPPFLTGSLTYYIERESPLGIWTIIDSTFSGTEIYRDTIIECTASYNYRISINTPNCSSLSNIEGGSFTDVLPPYKPVITYVTVDTATGNAIVNWNVNQAEDVLAYTILEQLPSGFKVSIDTVVGRNNTSYDVTVLDASQQSLTLGVNAFDDCLSGVPANYNTSISSDFHKTMFLQGNLDTCTREVILTWTNYDGWVSGVQSYEVYVSENNGQTILLSSLSGADITYIHQNVNRNSTYCYFVKAIQSGGAGYESFSNKFCLTILGPQLPNYLYMSSVSVEKQDQVEVNYIADDAADIATYRLERSLNETGPFQTVSVVSSNGVGIYSYLDTDVLTSSVRYYYRVLAVDECGGIADTSNLGSTLLLDGRSDDQTLINLLQWEQYIDWQSGVQSYNIYRGTNSNFSGGSPLITISGTTPVYQDDINNAVTPEGKFCYYIEAIENLNSFGTSAISKSNIQCLFLEPQMWIPNAFTPDGNNINDVFKPVARFIRREDYLFEVYNRWNQKIFESTDIQVGWDGTHKSKPVKEGPYMYIINFRDTFGNFNKRIGTITVIF